MAETAVISAIAGAIKGASATTIAVGAAATAAVASIAISSVQMKKAQADARKDGSRAPRDITVRSAIEPARIIYGQARTSGPVVYTNTASTPGTTDNSTLWTVISLCNHEVEDITDVWLDGDEILASQIVGGNVTSGKYGPIGSNTITNIYKRYGTSTQTHVTALSSAFTDWTSAYDGKGVAYIVTGFELGTATGGGEGVWAQGAPQNIRAVVKGKKVYDPRLDSTQTGIPGSGSHRLADSSTWEWSDNPALCVADYLFDDRLGMGAEGITYNEIDWEMVAAAATVCDGTVTSPAGNQKRFTCNGALSTGETYAENIKQLLSSMGGSITWSGGKFRIRALAYEAPTYSFTGDDVIGDIQIQPEVNRADRFNLVRGTFIDADSDYVATEFLPVESTTFRDDRDDGQSLNKQIKLPFTNNEYMAQRIAFKHLNIADQQLRCVVPMNYKAMKVAVGDRIQLSIDELTWTNKPFIVEGWVFAPDGGYELELREEDEDAYDDPVLADYSTRTYAGDVIFPDPDVPAPSGLTATNEQEAVVLSWDEPSRPSAYNEIIIYASSSSAFSGASEIGRTRGNTFRHEIDIVPATYPGSATFYYWVQAVDIEGETSIKNPNSSTSTIQGIAQKISTNDLDDDANFALTADWPSITDSEGTLPDDNATNNGSTINTDGDIAGSIDTATTGDIHGGQTGYDTGTGYFLGYDTNAYKFSIGNSSGDKLTFDGSNLAVTGNITADGGSIGGLTIGSDKIYLGSGTFNHTNTGFYVDDTGQFSLKDKLAFYPSDSTLRVKGNIEAEVISVTDSLQVAGNLIASSLEDGSITSTMLTEEAINAIYDRIATNLGGTNGDYKETTGSFTTSGGTILVGTSSDKFDHGDQEVVVELVENHGFSQNTDYSGTALDATVQFQVSADGTFTDLTSLNRTQTFTLGKYDLSQYYDGTYIWYYGPRLLTTTYTAAQLSDNTDYQFRAVITSVGSAFTGQTYPVTLEVNEGIQGVTSAGGDANTLDGLDSTQFLRSDQSDTMNGSLTITGDLTVQGTTVTLNTATLDVEDKNITLNYGAGDTSGSANGAGITIQDAVNASTDATILWDATNDEFDFSHKINVSGTSTFAGIRVNNSNTALSQGGGNSLRIQTNSGYVEVGPRNGSYSHFFTDRAQYYFEKPVHFDGQIYNYNAGLTDQPYWHAGNDGPSSGLDADTVDGLEASSFIRSDVASDVSDHTEWQDNAQIRLGNGADFRLYHDGTNTILRNHKVGSNTYIQSEDNAGVNHAMIYLRGDTSAPYVQLYYDGGEVMRTVSGGIKVYNTVNAVSGYDVNGTTRINSVGDGLFTSLYIGSTNIVDTNRNLTNIGTISSGAITSTGTSAFGNFRLTDASKMGFGMVKAGGSVAHTASVDEGIFWHTGNDYGIYRTSGAWSSPNYQQLRAEFITGIQLDGGSAYGKSGVDIQASGTSKVFVKSSHTYFNSIDLAISHSNTDHGAGTYFRGSSSHFVLGLAAGNTFYCNYANTTGQFRAYGSNLYWNDTIVLDGSRNLINIGRAEVDYVQTGSGLINRVYVSGWTNATTHDVIYNGWTAGTGDYISIKAAGNSTTGHGVIAIADQGFFVGTTSTTTGTPVGSSSTAPFTATHAKISSAGIDARSGGLLISGTTVIDSSREVTNVNISRFRTGNSSLYISQNNINTLNSGWLEDVDNHALWLNYRGYSNGFTRFRDLKIGDGKGNAIIEVDGSTRAVSLVNNSFLKIGTTTVLDISRNLTNIGTISSGAITSSGNLTASGNFEANRFIARDLTGSGIGNSYDERVVLLIPIIETNTAYTNILNGKLIARKTGGNVIDVFDVFAHSVWNDTRASFTSMGQRTGHKFVSCTYDGIKWLAIKFQYTANPYNTLHFEGVADTNVSGASDHILKVISYYDNNGGGVLNSEINNSIADYTPSATVFKGAANSYRFDDGVGTTNYMLLNSTGADVSGRVEADSLKVSGSPSILQNSADRSGLIEITDSGGGWTGIQISQNEGDHWSVMGHASSFGIYDDQQGEWILLHNQNADTSIYHNGNVRLTTTSGGGRVTGALEITGTGADTLNFSGASTSDARGVAFNGRIALSADETDGYLRLNQNLEFTNGVYIPSPVWINNDLRIADYIRHNGDDNTYLRFVAADDMQLVSGGRQMIRMDEGTDPDRLYFPNGSSYTDSNGNAVFAGNVTAYASDRRLKTRIKPIENALAKVMAIRGVTYDWIEGVEDLGFVPGRKNDCMGVIAQELEEAGVDQVIMPAPFDRIRTKETDWQDVSKSGEEYKTVDYDKLTALLIEAVKEQQTQIEALQAKIKELENGNH